MNKKGGPTMITAQVLPRDRTMTTRGSLNKGFFADVRQLSVRTGSRCIASAAELSLCLVLLRTAWSGWKMKSLLTHRGAAVAGGAAGWRTRAGSAGTQGRDCSSRSDMACRAQSRLSGSAGAKGRASESKKEATREHTQGRRATARGG